MKQSNTHCGYVLPWLAPAWRNPGTVHWFPNIGLRWGWVFLERTRILSGIQFTTHSIETFVVETKRFVSSFVYVTLTRQTCGQRSSRDAESNRQALGNYFSERICYMILISKCRGDWHLGLCATSVLVFGEPMRSGDFRKKNMFRCRKNRILRIGPTTGSIARGAKFWFSDQNQNGLHSYGSCRETNRLPIRDSLTGP